MLREVSVSHTAEVIFNIKTDTDPFLGEGKNLNTVARGILDNHKCMPECQLQLNIEYPWLNGAVAVVEYGCTTIEARQGFLCPEPNYPFQCAELLANLASLTEVPERPE